MKNEIFSKFKLRLSLFSCLETNMILLIWNSFPPNINFSLQARQLLAMKQKYLFLNSIFIRIVHVWWIGFFQTFAISISLFLYLTLNWTFLSSKKTRFVVLHKFWSPFSGVMDCKNTKNRRLKSQNYWKPFCKKRSNLQPFKNRGTTATQALFVLLSASSSILSASIIDKQ